MQIDMPHFLEQKDGLIRFTNINKLSYSLLDQITKRFIYLGYTDMDIDKTKEYLSRGTFLNKDQSTEILKILNPTYQKETLYSQSQIEADNTAAKEYYGLTDCFYLAGYLLTDGSLLDFSEGQSFQRTLDHRDIGNVIKISDLNTGLSQPVAAMCQFMNYGNIRVHQSGIDLTQPPNETQKRVLASFICSLPELFVDISNVHGINLTSFSYQFPKAYKVFGDIENFFKQFEIEEEIEEEIER